ncbi:MAG: GAF domain-containing protein [Bacteroidales bacterium]|jgi:GAF domain-containing protein|nr:GAF domain-containing protein [Bacteroidales bacterium]MCI2133678.1 GAF domain-containing protein [Bacteroidales bacterium]
METKKQKYERMLLSARSIAKGETNIIAKMANFCALIQSEFHFWWTGFYLVDNAMRQLIVGPFQGPLACMRIEYGKGVCGSAWKAQKTIVVPDVKKFPGHIACSEESKSEIVVPVFSGAEIIAVLDIDSDQLSTFDEIDQTYLEDLVRLLA